MILESGTVGFANPSSITTKYASWFNVTQTLGCGNQKTDQNSLLRCMRGQNTSSITAAAAGMTFGPTADNQTAFTDYPARSKSGNFIKVPVLIGSNDYEGGLFAAQLALTGKSQPRSYWDTYGLIAFTCPAGMRANITISHGIPTWRYRWFGVFPNTNLTAVPNSGAYHFSEIPVLFDTAPFGEGIPAATLEEISFGSYARGAWAAFAKNPTAGLSTYGGGWPTYSPTNETLIRLGYNNQNGINLAAPSMYDTTCNVNFPANTTSVASPSGSPKSSTGSLKHNARILLLSILAGSIVLHLF